MGRQVVVTRAEPGASKTSGHLERAGFEVLNIPAIELVFHDSSGFLPPGPLDVCLFTSANGVKAAARAGWSSGRTAYCVGQATRNAAVDAGWYPVESADGDADALVGFILSRFEPETAPGFVHIANDAAAGQIVDRLNACGYAARFVPAYGSQPIAKANLQPELAKVRPGAALLVHSAKGAEAVQVWCEQGSIPTSEMILVGLSDRAVRPLLDTPFLVRAVAAHPNEEELIKTLHSVAEPGVT